MKKYRLLQLRVNCQKLNIITKRRFSSAVIWFYVAEKAWCGCKLVVDFER